MPWTDEVLASQSHPGPAKLTLEWEKDGQKVTVTANVKDPTILAVGEREIYPDYGRVLNLSKSYYLEFDKLEDDIVYRVQVHQRFDEIRKVVLPELTVANMVKAAEQIGVDRNTKWTIEEYEGKFLLTPEKEDTK